MTLIEVLLVLALITAAASLGSAINFNTYRARSIGAERDMLASLLMRARAQSLHGVCAGTCASGQSHGVYYDGAAHAYVLFQGDDCLARDARFDATFPASAAIRYDGAACVIFASGSATSSGGRMTLSDDAGHVAHIEVGSEGQILRTQ